MTDCTIEQRLHSGYSESISRNVIGRWQYIYTGSKGKISLISLPDYFRNGETLWEIYCLQGDLFEDIERFDSFYEADKKAKEYVT